ncbi:hypothetical protein E2553_45620 [Paraburkholderia dipogonis]|uniref:Transmembrane protein n=1 Tax=Paraburkholderia dipogonis TaxID=1211383 RepID=A0A4Y8MHJ5_9BURK|nr:hypothetical protein [Paraburkholderia dipogonis]TFE36912.1 hypothetical protein E2553_45620 [Paraburkholderia dipogonis]
MKMRTLAGWVAIIIATAMPFTVLSMARAYFENGTARATLGSREDEVRRLAELDGDIHSLAPAQASVILSPHSLESADALAIGLVAALHSLSAAQAEYRRSVVRLWRASVIGFLCVAATSWAAVSLATVWPRPPRAKAVAA